jgi:hypothetical protein
MFTTKTTRAPGPPTGDGVKSNQARCTAAQRQQELRAIADRIARCAARYHWALYRLAARHTPEAVGQARECRFALEEEDQPGLRLFP